MAQIKTKLAYGVSGTLATANLADDAVTAAKIADNAVVTAAINGSAVTDAKISAVAATKLSGTIADARFPATLPALNGSALTALNASNVASGTLATARYVQGGISQVSTWRLSSSFTGDSMPISSSWEEPDTYGLANGAAIGSDMVIGSGVWTFPVTGIWKIEFHGEFFKGGDSKYNQAIIETTTDNSSYNEAAKSSSHIKHTESGTTYSNSLAVCIFDVTNVSTHKCRLGTSVSENTVSTAGHTSTNKTMVNFIRLGDT